MSTQEKFKLIYHVPSALEHLDATKEAVFATGAGTFPGGKYAKCAFETPGHGQFLPVAEKGANPHTGTPGRLERTEETRVEILCLGRDIARAAVAALKKAHPYEEVSYEVYKMEDF